MSEFVNYNNNNNNNYYSYSYSYNIPDTPGNDNDNDNNSILSFKLNNNLPTIIDLDITPSTPSSSSLWSFNNTNNNNNTANTNNNTSLRTSSFSNTTTPFLIPSPGSINSFSSNSNPNSNLNRFSLPSIPDNKIDFNNDSLLLDINNTTNNNNQFHNHLLNYNSRSSTRRNTLFSNTSNTSNTSNSSTSTANSISISIPLPSSSINNNNDKSSTLLSSFIDLANLKNFEIINLSKDQNGCRMLQKKIDNDVNYNLPIIFNAIYTNSTNLMIDPFGNYLIQKLIINCNDDQISLILMEISNNLKTIATNLHGTRALQKLIGCLNTINHHDLLSFAIKPIIVDLIHDINGNHVIQKIISHYNNNDLNFLIDLIILNLFKISTHKHGCCILQKILIKCSNFQIQLVCNEILKISNLLMNDQFGNYVIQYLISLNLINFNINLLNLVSNDLINLSCGKFSSNVVEKCIKLNPNNLFNEINLHPILKSLLNIQNLIILIKDQFGNYVVQTALEISNWSIKFILAEMIKPLLPDLKFTNYGKRIHTKVLNILSEYDNNNFNNFNNYNNNFTNNTQSQSIPSSLLPPINFTN